MTEPMGERGRQGAAPLGGTDIETIERALDETNYPPGTKLWVDAHAALDRIEQVVEAAKAVAAEPYIEGASWFKPLREALGALDG